MIGRLNTGQTLSGIGHVGLISWALFGGLFASEPLTFEVTEVTAVSSEEFAALMARQDNPVAVADMVTPDPPEIDDATPDMAPVPDEPVTQVQPEVTQPTEPDTPPEVVPQIVPQAEVSDEPPSIEPPSEDVAVVLPNPDIRPQPRPAPRVAPEPVAQPEPDVRIDDQVREEVATAEDAEVVQEEQEATSPEESTTEIVTEAAEPAQAAPSRSLRPQTRPTRTAQQQQQPVEDPRPTPEPEPETPPADTSVTDALTEALGTGGTDTTPEPTGPPLTRGEKDALVVSVERCWNVGSLSSDALRTTVVVSVEMNRDATPIIASIRLIESSGGAGSAVEQAFEAGRRAIIRCGSSGFDLPADKFDQWRKIEMIFNPEKMRMK